MWVIKSNLHVFEVGMVTRNDLNFCNDIGKALSMEIIKAYRRSRTVPKIEKIKRLQSLRIIPIQPFLCNLVLNFSLDYDLGIAIGRNLHILWAFLLQNESKLDQQVWEQLQYSSSSFIIRRIDWRALNGARSECAKAFTHCYDEKKKWIFAVFHHISGEGAVPACATARTPIYCAPIDSPDNEDAFDYLITIASKLAGLA